MIRYDFENKIVLVIAGSSGIGRELAIQYLKYGAKVCVISSSETKLKNLSNECLNYKKNLITKKFDLEKKCSLRATKKIFKFIKKKFNSDIDILICNSGGPPPIKIINLDENTLEKSLNMNLINQMFFAISAISLMNKKGWGRIINLLSSTAKEPSKNMVLSNLTRSALCSFAKTLSMETAKKGITVNNILTGGVATSRLIKLVEKRVGKKKLKDELLRIESDRPVGYLATPENFVQIIIFLTSEESSYISGSSIFVDGGASKSLF
jgi:3-oxoacyl-[acyl-carrier protein] reductase